MAFLKRNKITADNATGFSTNSNESGGRFFRRDGKANTDKRGMGLLEKYSWYHTMLALPRWKFFLLLFIIFIAINIFFAFIYLLIGVEHLGGLNPGNGLKKFEEAFFFSTQTFTTVGYGRINPIGFLTSAVAAFQAFLGLLSFALATGLLYGRFSRPQAFLKFSDMALIAPYKEGVALMFRMVPYKNNHLSEAEAKVTLGMRIEENGKITNKFYPLNLELSKVNALALSWTIVHEIDEESPMYGLTAEELRQFSAEIMVFVKAFDEGFSNTVISRTSYVVNEIVWGAKFTQMFHPASDKSRTILYIDKVGEYEMVQPRAMPPSPKGEF